MSISRFMLSAILMGILIPSTAWAQAPQVDERIGVEVALMVGSTACVDDGDGDCTNGELDLDSSWGSTISAGYRWSPNMGIYLDMNLGELDMKGSDATAEASMTITTVMPTLRFFFPQETADLWLGIGAGLGAVTITGPVDVGSDDTVTIERSNPLDAKIEAGAAYYLTPAFSLGFSAQMIFLVNGAGEVCLSSTLDNFEDGCEDVDSGHEIFDLLQLGVNLRHRF